MNIPQLGPLYPDSDSPEELSSSPVSVPYFDGLPLTFILDGLTDADTADVQRAISAFFAMGPAARFAAGRYVFQNYRFIADRVDEYEIGFHVADAEAIWSYVHPSAIFISRRRRDKLIYVQIIARCDWDPEHGLQIIYRRGDELSRVSDRDGHLTHADAFGLPEDQDRISELP